jgi:uncharacterized protein (DUF427 family)
MMAISRTLSGQMMESGFADHPDHKINIEPVKNTVTVIVGERVLVKTANALVLHEANYAPVYYFPHEDIDDAVLMKSGHSSWCPFKGKAGYLSIIDGNGDLLKDAVWSYEDPFEEVAAIKDYLGFMAPHAAITVGDA